MVKRSVALVMTKKVMFVNLVDDSAIKWAINGEVLRIMMSSMALKCCGCKNRNTKAARSIQIKKPKNMRMRILSR